MKLNAKHISSEHIGHLGIIASIIKKIGLIEKINSRIPLSEEKGAKLCMGTRVAAMILNGMGFVNKRLYMHEQFFADKPVSRLLGANVCPDSVNDDALGRCLDAIYKYGTTKLFSEIAFEIGKEQARKEGKPEQILEKIALGKLNKYFKENTLLNQAFIKDNKKSVSQYLQEIEKDLTVTGFVRFGLKD